MTAHAVTATTAHPAGGNAPPPWIFGVLTIPFGVSAAFASTTLGRLLSLHQIPEPQIAGIIALAILPAGWQFLWAPVVDVGLRRRTWLILLSFVGGLLVAGSLWVPVPERLGLFTAVVVAGQVVTGLVSACFGGLAARCLPDELRGRAAGYINAGNLGGGALGAGVTLWLMDRSSPLVVGVATFLMIALPSLAALFVDEPLEAPRSLGSTFRSMVRDVVGTVRRREGWTGILFFLSPVGTAAGIQLFSSIADSYHASAEMVTFVTGFAGGLVTALGSLVGGYVCDRMNRRLAYFLAGALTAVAAVAMALGPMTPLTYAWGSLVYLFVAGLCYAAFTALVLEVIGRCGPSASTQYTLCSAAGNQAIALVIWVDGLGFAWWSHHEAKETAPRGLLGADALANVAGIILLSVLFWIVRRMAPPPAPVETANPAATAVLHRPTGDQRRPASPVALRHPAHAPARLQTSGITRALGPFVAVRPLLGERAARARRSSAARPLAPRFEPRPDDASHPRRPTVTLGEHPLRDRVRAGGRRHVHRGAGAEARGRRVPPVRRDQAPPPRVPR